MAALSKSDNAEKGPVADRGLVPLGEIVCTEELWRRPRRSPDYEAESRAVAKLVRVLAESPRAILDALAATMLELLRADSAGISLLTQDGKNFHWAAIAGDWSPHLGGGTPRKFGPCGDVLDCNRPLLFTHWERRYPYLQEATPLAEEGLLVPFHVAGRAVGTIWTIAHRKGRKFDAEDLRQLESIARIASAAYQAVQLLDAEEAGRAALDAMKEAFESRQLVQAVVEASPECISIVGVDGALRYVNPAGLQIIGAADLEQIRGTTIYDLIAPEERGNWQACHDRVCRGERLSWKADLTGLRGSRRHIEIQGVPLPLPEGGCAVLTIAQDITERRQQELRLHDSERRLRELLEALPAAVYTTDAEGRLVFYNEAAVRFAGRRPAVGDQWCVTWKLYHPDGTPMPHEECPMAIALKEGRPVRGAEAVAERPDGTRVPFIPYPTPLRDNEGKLIGAVNMLVDISDRKAAEENLQRLNETLEKRVREEVAERERVQHALFQVQKMEAIGQLTGGIAHDFNNLLTAVIGNLDALLSERPGVKSQRHIEAALRSAERGAMLTQQLLAYARRQHLEPRPVNVNQLIRDIGDLLHRTLGGLVNIETRLTENLWYASADPTQLELAILNLAINARDAMPLGGSLYIETRNLPADERARPADLSPGDYIHLRISDTGEGMTPETLAKAMDPFFTTKEVGKGSGLGLSQVSGVVNQSGGTIRLESEPGNGTTVHIWLPRTAQTPAQAKAEDALAEAHSRLGTVLVVDDDPDVRRVTVEALRRHGYRVEEAASGAEALELIDAGVRLDVALVDYAMPRMSGTEFIHLARLRRPGMAFVLTTGYADPGAIAPEGDAIILKKPYRVPELLRSLERTRELEDRRSPAASNVALIRLPSRTKRT